MKKLRRSLSLAAALLLLAIPFVAGCTSNAPPSASQPASQTEGSPGASQTENSSVAGQAEDSTDASQAEDSADASQPEDPAQGAAPEPPEPITLSIIMNWQNTTASIGISDDAVGNYIKEKTGVSLDISALSDSDFVDAMNTKISAGDLPDIMYTHPSGAMFNSLLTAGAALPLDGLLTPENCPDLLSDKASLAMIEANRLMSPDGKLYTIGLQKGTNDSGNGTMFGPYIRWDLYKQLGYPEIKTYVDLANALIEMQRLEPETAEGLPTYSNAAFQGGFVYPGVMGMNYLSGLFPVDWGTNMLLADISTGLPLTANQLYDPDSQYWKSIEYFNILSRSGTFDPDSFTQGIDVMTSKGNAGQYMAVCASWLADSANAFFESSGQPEKCMIELPASTFGFTSISLFSNMAQGERNYAINSKCAYPERAIQLLDFLNSYEFSFIANNGLEGTNWNMSDGVPTPTPEFLAMTQEELDAQARTSGVFAYQKLAGHTVGERVPSTGTYVSLRVNAKPLMPAQEDFVRRYGKTTLSDVYSGGMKQTANSLIIDSGVLPDDFQVNLANHVTFTQTQEALCILAADDASFAAQKQAYIDGLDQFKTQEIFEFWLGNAQASSQKMQPAYDILFG
jgi:ABC-type glycerol-3-phosphate transport system substrate-binding protein